MANNTVEVTPDLYLDLAEVELLSYLGYYTPRNACGSCRIIAFSTPSPLSWRPLPTGLSKATHELAGKIAENADEGAWEDVLEELLRLHKERTGIPYVAFEATFILDRQEPEGGGAVVTIITEKGSETFSTHEWLCSKIQEVGGER